MHLWLLFSFGVFVYDSARLTSPLALNPRISRLPSLALDPRISKLPPLDLNSAWITTLIRSDPAFPRPHHLFSMIHVYVFVRKKTTIFSMHFLVDCFPCSLTRNFRLSLKGHFFCNYLTFGPCWRSHKTFIFLNIFFLILCHIRPLDLKVHLGSLLQAQEKNVKAQFI